MITKNRNRCISAMEQAIAQYCENFEIYDAAKCEYVNRPEVSEFLMFNDQLLGFGD
jgi:hypothetical protein